jgi:hypothetical protein
LGERSGARAQGAEHVDQDGFRFLEFGDPGADIGQLLLDARGQVGGDRACADLFGGYRVGPPLARVAWHEVRLSVGPKLICVSPSAIPPRSGERTPHPGTGCVRWPLRCAGEEHQGLPEAAAQTLVELARRGVTVRPGAVEDVIERSTTAVAAQSGIQVRSAWRFFDPASPAETIAERHPDFQASSDARGVGQPPLPPVDNPELALLLASVPDVLAQSGGGRPDHRRQGVRRSGASSEPPSPSAPTPSSTSPRPTPSAPAASRASSATPWTGCGNDLGRPIV